MLARRFTMEDVRLLEEEGAANRTVVMHLYRCRGHVAGDRCGTSHLIGSYGFSYHGKGRFRYHPDGMPDPTVQVAMTDAIWWDVMLRRISVAAAWKHGDMGFVAADGKMIYHTTFLMKLFKHWREYLAEDLEGRR